MMRLNVFGWMIDRYKQNLEKRRTMFLERQADAIARQTDVIITHNLGPDLVVTFTSKVDTWGTDSSYWYVLPARSRAEIFIHELANSTGGVVWDKQNLFIPYHQIISIQLVDR